MPLDKSNLCIVLYQAYTFLPLWWPSSTVAAPGATLDSGYTDNPSIWMKGNSRDELGAKLASCQYTLNEKSSHTGLRVLKAIIYILSVFQTTLASPAVHGMIATVTYS